MGHVLTKLECKALDKLSFEREKYLISGNLPGIGAVTMKKLVELGLAEVGPSVRHYNESGWRITPDGWRCMYGKTYEEMIASGGQHHPLKVWEWPPAD